MSLIQTISMLNIFRWMENTKRECTSYRGLTQKRYNPLELTRTMEKENKQYVETITKEIRYPYGPGIQKLDDGSFKITVCRSECRAVAKADNLEVAKAIQDKLKTDSEYFLSCVSSILHKEDTKIRNQDIESKSASIIRLVNEIMGLVEEGRMLFQQAVSQGIEGDVLTLTYSGLAELYPGHPEVPLLRLISED